MADYRSTRQTVRAALDLLRVEGLVERLQGNGTLVISTLQPTRLVEAHGVTGELPQNVRARLLDWTVVAAPAAIAARLDEAPGTPVLRVDYVGLLDGDPQVVATNYLRPAEASRVHERDLSHHWYEFLASGALTIGASTMLIEAVLADALLAELLHCNEGAPLLAMEQLIHDDDGRPYDLAFIRCRGDRLALLSTASAQVATGPAAASTAGVAR